MLLRRMNFVLNAEAVCLLSLVRFGILRSYEGQVWPGVFRKGKNDCKTI